jgi:hypothetical protein
MIKIVTVANAITQSKKNAKSERKCWPLASNQEWYGWIKWVVERKCVYLLFPQFEISLCWINFSAHFMRKKTQRRLNVSEPFHFWFSFFMLQCTVSVSDGNVLTFWLFMGCFTSDEELKSDAKDMWFILKIRNNVNFQKIFSVLKFPTFKALSMNLTFGQCFE